MENNEFFMNKPRKLRSHQNLSLRIYDQSAKFLQFLFGLYVSGFWHIHTKTPRGIVVCEQ